MNGNCIECEFRWDCKINPAVCENMTKPVLTNADKIRAMTDEELAEFFCPDTPRNSPWCEPIGRTVCGKAPCRKCMLKWLQQPAETEGEK